jgi:hypothetical protein
LKYNEMPRKARQKNLRLWLVPAFVAIRTACACLAQQVTVSVSPAADAFVWSLAPSNNYGAAGSLSVSGAAAVNGSEQQNGLFDSLMRFPMAGVAASLNASFGSNNWLVTAASLVLTEVAEPNNTIFNRGVGAFEVRSLASAAWSEGTGTPRMPTGDGVTYGDLGSVLNPAADVALGQFTNTATDGPVPFSLDLSGSLLSNVLAGADVNLYLTAASPSVGFTFNSRNFGATNAWPSLQVSAVPRPVAGITGIESIGSNQVAIPFNTASNWNSTLQAVDTLTSGASRGWSNLLTIPAKPFDSHAQFVDGATNRQRFYRLLLSQ